MSFDQHTTFTFLGFGAIFLFIAGLSADVYLISQCIKLKGAIRSRIDGFQKIPWTDTSAIRILSGIIAAWLMLQLIWPVDISVFKNPASGSALKIVLRTLIIPVTVLALVLWQMHCMKMSAKEAFGFGTRKWTSNLSASVFTYLAAIPPMIAAGLLMVLFLRNIGYPVDRQPIVQYLARPGNPVWFNLHITFTAVIVAPLVEETIFRGIILPVLAKYARYWIAVVFVSLFFAFLHGHAPSVAPLFLMGVAFSMAYTYTGSLSVAILSHSLFNAVSLVLLFITRDIEKISL